MFSQSAYSLDVAKYHGGYYDGYGQGTSTSDLPLGTLVLTKYNGGSYDGYSQGTSTSDLPLGTHALTKYNGGSYDGYGQGTSASDLPLGSLALTKYHGGSYDGYGSSISASGIALRKVMLATLMAKPGNRMVTLTLVPESGLDCADLHVYRSSAEVGLYKRINIEIVQAAYDSAAPPEYCFTDKRVDNGVTYWYKIAGVSNDGTETTVGSISATPAASAADLPKAFGLSQNFPNPFNPLTEIRFQVPEASHVSIAVYDELGRLVCVLLDKDKDAGDWSVAWDARYSASGFYFVRMQTKSFVGVRKMVLVK